MSPKTLVPAGIAAASLIILAASVKTFQIKSGHNPMTVPAYTVKRVIDGDTFETTENQLIRLGSVEAPENGLCGSEQATKALEKLVLNKPIYIKVYYRDPYFRLISQVYNPDGYVNEKMIKNGYAYYRLTGKSEYGKLLSAAKYARENKLGIHSSKCTQENNPDNPKCNIKGNNNETKIYFMPDCYQYKNAVVELYKGDQWFCNEIAAQKAGYRKATQCN